MREALYILGGLVHELQKERGCSAMLLGSQGALFSDEIQSQFKKTDAAIKKFETGLEHWTLTNSSNQNLQSELRSSLEICQELHQFRKRLLALELTTTKTTDHYSHQIIGRLMQQMVEIALLTKESNPTFVSALNSFLNWKERIGLERVIGLRGFIAHNFENQDYLEKFLCLLSEQNNYQNTYMALANDTQKRLVQDVLQDPGSKKLEHIHELLRRSPDTKELKELSPIAWFELVTAKIEALQGVMNQLIDTVYEDHSNNAPNNVTHIANEKKRHLLRKYMPLINSSEIFSGLTQNSLNVLMQYAQIREYPKGKLLFLESEQANRLYIILKGWVKIFQGSMKGEETVLQMLSSGDTIMETAVFLNLGFPVNAQIAESATILSLPAPVFRERLKQDTDLATNFLTSMSYRSQNLIHNMAHSRLKTVDERVGWFLLKLAVEQGHQTKDVELPYDKSLIASYLDMKRETFSRALKRFKEKGFEIKNNKVILPTQNSLCEFCDQSLAEICPRHNSEDCPHQQLFRVNDTLST